MLESFNAFATTNKSEPIIHRVCEFEHAQHALAARAKGNHPGKIVITVSGIDA
ncbi:hypothetical protein [Acidovorax sp. CCYZU-2555]|uniref:hypothetical protein n=1 Tax=Acidovorax sp. CCYZU-2555 TaxID=2835042 RepID=UPI001BCF3536|nr:hypothetical protein [Acidovorax sp. CCYZU-2555]MBS7776832.1 hypothetical protein [Acidovorax sp. CCYZU-2555]